MRSWMLIGLAAIGACGQTHEAEDSSVDGAGPAPRDAGTTTTDGSGPPDDPGRAGGQVGDAGAAASPPDCDPARALAAGDHDFALTHDGVTYRYLVHVPPGYDPTVRTPLVLNWHGLTSNARQQRFFSAMDPVADAHRFIVAYPDSPDGSWNTGYCCAFLAPNRDDVGFALALVEELKTRACIDERRVYSTGMSNGGYMSHRLACDHAEVFAAVAPVAGTLSVSTCSPSRPIPVMHFHGTADMNLPYGGRPGVPSVRETLQAWADRDGCAREPTVTFSRDDATCETWTRCDGGVEVRLCTFRGEGHCWPGQAVCPFGAATTTLDASEEAASFFERFHL